MFSASARISGLVEIPAKIRRGASKGMDRLAKVTQDRVARKKGRTYGRRIPQSGTGRPKWKRSGAYLKGTAVEAPSPLERRVYNTGKSAEPITNYDGGYGQRLAALPTGPDGINRSNDAFGDAKREVEPQAGPIVEQAVANELRL